MKSKEKSIKNLRIVSVILYCLLFFVSIYVLGNIVAFNLVTPKYLRISVCVFFLICVLLIVLSTKKINSKLRIIYDVFCVFLILLLSSGVYCFDKARAFSYNYVETKGVISNNDTFSIFVSGIDCYGNIDNISRSDVNLIVTVNTCTHKVLLTSIPRDYYVKLHGISGLKDKLTHTGIYGIKMSVQTVEDLLGLDIDYYIRTNFTTLVGFVDAIGGVDIALDGDINHLNGAEALALTRDRYSHKSGDRARLASQQKIFSAILKKMISFRHLIRLYVSILDSLSFSLQTNIPSDLVYDLVKEQIKSMPKWSLEQYALDGKDSRNFTYSFAGKKLYVMEPDTNTIVECRKKILEW